MSLLEVKDVSVSFSQYTSLFKRQYVTAMEGLHLSVDKGQVVAVVGSSGSGKSLLAHAIMGILPANAQMTGGIEYKGNVLDKRTIGKLRGKEIALVPQSINYLDPLMRVGRQVHQSSKDKQTIRKQQEIFRRYQLHADVDKLYPYQLSGGMARRVLVATATMNEAQLIVADEPTPGMHPDDVKEALQRFKELAEGGAGVIFITHDIDAALKIADKVAVFYAGTTIEVALKEDFVNQGEKLRHPYTKALWNALPQNAFQPIEGRQPLSNSNLPGCLFADRCKQVTDSCLGARPELRKLRQGDVRCFHAT